jgi:hypothetical protein
MHIAPQYAWQGWKNGQRGQWSTLFGASTANIAPKQGRTISVQIIAQR